jgi:hypothetical protein
VIRLDTSAYTVPTDAAEGDGTFAWTSTTLVLVQASDGDATASAGHTDRAADADVHWFEEPVSSDDLEGLGVVRDAVDADVAAPHQHLAVCAAVPNLRHLEWYDDHVRIEHMFFDGTVRAKGGNAPVNRDAPSSGLAFRAADAERYRVA